MIARLGLNLGLTAPRSSGASVAPANVSSIDATGWSAQLNTGVLAQPAMTTNGVSEFGADGATPKTVTLTRQGFDSSGNALTNVSEDLLITKVVRQPYPNQALATTATVALSDYVYSTDTVVGMSGTNSSGEISPKPVANWIMPHRIVVGNSLDWEITAWHRNARNQKEVACVWVRATDGTNTTAWQIVSATGISGRAGDRYPVVSYKGTLDITSLTDNTLVTLEGWVFPHIGADNATYALSSILKSSQSTEARGFSPRYFRKDTTRAASPPLAYISTTGVDATGLWSTSSATASANPFLTVKGALDAIAVAARQGGGSLASNDGTRGIPDGCEIRVGNDGGTPFVCADPTVAKAQQIAALTITRDTGVARANARVSFGTTAFTPNLGVTTTSLNAALTTSAIRFKDIAIVRTGALTFRGPNSTTQLEVIMDDVDFDNGSQTATILNNSHLYTYGFNMTNGATGWANAATYEIRCFRGVQGSFGTNFFEGYLFIGSKLTACGSPAAGTRSESGSIRAFFSATLTDSTKSGFIYGSAANVDGAVLAQYFLEYTPATASSATRLSGDAFVGSTTHIIHHYATHAGAFNAGRDNDFYDEGTAARTHKLMSCVGLNLVQQNTKHDVFKTDGTRVGGWSFLYGVGCRGVFTQYIDANNTGLGTAFAQAWPGLKCNIGTGWNVRNDPLFTSNQATTTLGGTSASPTFTAGAGGGDYTIGSGSPCKSMVTNGVLSHDLAGTARSATTSAGAYQ